MSTIPTLTIRFCTLLPNNRVSLAVTTVTDLEEQCTIRLPFALDQVSLILDVLSAVKRGNWPPSEQNGFDISNQLTTLAQLGIAIGHEHGVLTASPEIHLGELIGGTLVADPVLKQAMDTLFDVAARVGEGELVLQFEDDAAVLAVIPWELALFNGAPLLRVGQIMLNCTRVLSSSDPILNPRSYGKKLAVLALAPEAGFDEQLRLLERKARETMATILRDLPVEFTVMHPVTMITLRHHLEQNQVDIIDFYGHGRFIDGEGQLLLDGPDGQQEWVNARRLITLPSLPPLVVLHACESGRLDAATPYAGVAAALCRAKVQAVLAMQLGSRASSATDQVVPTLYGNLAVGRSLQRALAEVRRVLYSDGVEQTAWYFPILYLRQPSPHPFRLLEPRPNPFVGLGALHDSQLFVGRTSVMRRLWSRLRAQGNLALIGPAESGKSTLLRYIADQAKEQLGPTVEAVRLTMHRDLKRDEIQTELVQLLGGRHRKELQQRLRGRHIILLLDDIGQLSPEERGLNVRQWLRSLSQDRTNGTIQLVVTSKQPIAKLFPDLSNTVSPLHNALTDSIELGPFDEIEARKFIAHRLSNTPFREEAFRGLLKDTLYPGLLQEACRILYDQLHEQWD